MTKFIEKSARTIDDALNAALEELHLDRDDINYSYEVVKRPKSGFLGIGSVDAVVKVSYEAPDEPKKKQDKPKKDNKPAKTSPKMQNQENKAKSGVQVKTNVEKKAPKAVVNESADKAEVRKFLDGLFEKMGVEADIEISDREGGGLDVELSGSNMGALIGRRGETLDAIQHLTNYVISRGNDKHSHINVDAESYRAKREESLTRLAEKMAEKAIKYKRSMALEPMNSYERHVIHTALQNYEGVTTSSSGEEPNRRVVVSYVKTANEQSNKPKVKEWA